MRLISSMSAAGLCALTCLIAPIGCGSGPTMRPVDSSALTSAEHTAHRAAERTRAGHQGLIYASSEQGAGAQAEAQKSQQAAEMANTTAELRLTFDEEGRLLIDGQPVAPAEDAEDADALSASEGSPNATVDADALIAALQEALDALEPADRLRILITLPAAPQRFDRLFSSLGTVLVNTSVPVEVHLIPTS
ncbi:hypothetical protein DL240_09345 [Lujinxingia litoralis]|uniref:Biopolymer transporter ExbD n=1 Tax=Lujinxingia litoralis TaxID=2211119 RepID=A0A328C8T1_9DELT|nr:hypothetical protein [Lujinxingia litoralis]RAL23080.1 hypothetical protein DL240_09345 [Lujinxingia litoralis]